MLDIAGQSESIADAIDRLPTEIVLPDSWKDFFDERGALPTVQHERRQFVRFRLRTIAAMRNMNEMPNIIRSKEWRKVFAKDVSRAGFSFLHSEQLFPGESIELVIDDSHRYVGRVRRCRKVSPKCYVVGMQFCADSV